MSYNIEDVFSACDFSPNASQKEAIVTVNGPLLIIAGPGSGKTEVLIFRTLNMLLCHNIPPKDLLLCTFTEKAATQLKERLKLNLAKIGAAVDISEMALGTIHSICNGLIKDNLRDSGLGKNYEVLEELTQKLFLFENFRVIVGGSLNEKFLTRWASKWTTIDNVVPFLNKITEECIDPQLLLKDKDMFVRELGRVYLNYFNELKNTNRIDFAFQQAILLKMLRENERVREKLRERFHYIMVDEYQDTNYVQEQILLTLAHPRNNICVVGDEDQSLYRFRGATVRNILEFPSHFGNSVRQVKMETNYRSDPKIIAFYDRFMASGDWVSDDGKKRFRFDKSIKPNPNRMKIDYDSALRAQTSAGETDAEQVAAFVAFLHDEGIIRDLNQVAILLYSVRAKYSEPYIQALKKRGINCYAPRARAFFDNIEVQYAVGAFVHMLNYRGDYRGDIKGQAMEEMVEYCDSCLSLLDKLCRSKCQKLGELLNKRAQQIEDLGERGSLDVGLLDIFYQMLAYEPFSSFLENEENAHNLAIFSTLLTLFQQYYHYPIITGKSLPYMRLHFFNSYLRFLLDGGINEYEDPYEVFPSGKVQLMTIHQSKGLEFPVVIVDSLDRNIGTPKDVDETLGKYYHRPKFEPLDRITDFDRRRLFYVAFSRAKNFLVLTCAAKPKDYFLSVWNDLPRYREIEKNALKKVEVEPPEHPTQKLEFSLTSHINVYDVCPRQYLFYREYEFMPARSAPPMFFGTVVHQTIEDIHRHVLDNRPEKLDEERVIDYFDLNFETLKKRGIHPLSQAQRDAALTHVLTYFRNNQDFIRRVIETEVEITVEKKDYYLTGILDLILGEEGTLDIVDFKAQLRPDEAEPAVASYKRQLATYSYQLERKRGKRPDRAFIYWTGEADRNKALMQVDISKEDVDKAIQHFDFVVRKIRQKNFAIKSRPPLKVCRDCDFRHYCRVKLPRT
jgi:DNA helicase-2/ATP-dependent DNA helicase PcrA